MRPTQSAMDQFDVSQANAHQNAPMSKGRKAAIGAAYTLSVVVLIVYVVQTCRVHISSVAPTHD